MNRRDFWLLRATPRDRVFELPCERLYMQLLDARRPQPDSRSAQLEDSLGEPEARHDVRTPVDLFDDLARELSAADVLRVVGRDWLADDDLKQEVDRLVSAFVEKGGRVETA